ncbi:snRNA-activating protein complex subunit 1 [Geodia barretti]|uniref:snRNA-activating protein complex subunit 1 n=1 Tax=Geodia barretti TaxID=519541 RepID=A0AA35TRP9_GEOBA|nr:snRNA-activating protein complex subunit 1 [Geodia barretti]
MRYLISRSRDHERLAGLYLIYTVFCTQPLNPKALIRVTADDWTALIELQEVIREKKYAEAGYILHYLRKERAFTLTYTSQQVYVHAIHCSVCVCCINMSVNSSEVTSFAMLL